MSFRRAVLDAGTTAHYRDATYYDHAYRTRKDDVAFYVDAARRHGGPVLELGCGTARVTAEIAKLGVPIVGVDLMPSMLDEARIRIAKLPRDAQSCVTLRRGDLQSVRLKQRFPLVISPFNVFMHLYERVEVERALATVAAHLTPRGRFVFDVLVPYPAGLARDPMRSYRSRPVRLPSDGKRYGYTESFHYDPVTQVQLVTMAFEELGNQANTFITPLAHRQFFPAELEALLHYNGFVIEQRFGDFERGPLDETSDSQVIVARLRPRRR